MFADIPIAFIVRALIQLFRSYRAKSWPIVTAKVTTAEKRHSGIGCPVVDLTYKYRMNGEPFTGSHAEPFLLGDSFNDYLEQHPRGSELIVRVKPGVAESSVVRDRDLYFQAHGYRLDA